MSDEKTKLSGPDLANIVALSTVAEGAMLLGHAHGESVLLAPRRNELFAICNVCTHYGSPLNEGLFVDDTIRCRWHHACFSLRIGDALRAPALDPVSRWRGGVVTSTEEGQLDARDCTITYRNGGKKLAVAVIHRDLEGLRAQVEFEKTIAPGNGRKLA